jgi:hypothetical protein
MVTEEGAFLDGYDDAGSREQGTSHLDPTTLVRVVEEVSRADGAAGWCLGIGGMYGAFGGYLSADAADEIYGRDPLVRTAGALQRISPVPRQAT